MAGLSPPISIYSLPSRRVILRFQFQSQRLISYRLPPPFLKGSNDSDNSGVVASRAIRTTTAPSIAIRDSTTTWKRMPNGTNCCGGGIMRMMTLRWHKASFFLIQRERRQNHQKAPTSEEENSTTKRSSGLVESSREEKIQRKTSRLLSRLPTHENIYTVPNILTFSRLIAAPLVGYLLVNNHHAAALSLFAYAGITDLIDGYIARRYNLQTVVGTIIDPAADKLLMVITVVCLGLNRSIPLWLAILILGRDIGLTISAIYYRWISLPPPKTMARYWDFSLPSAEVKPTMISKVNTALQLLLVGSAMAMPILPEWLLVAAGLHQGMVGLQYIVAATTIWSGLGYVFSKDAVKILINEEVKDHTHKH